MSEVESVKSMLSMTQAEILRLKNLPAKPKITPSTLDAEKAKTTDKKRPGSAKQKKKRN